MTLEDKLRMATEMDAELGHEAGSVTVGTRSEHEVRRAEQTRLSQTSTHVLPLPPEGRCWAMATQAGITCNADSFEDAVDALLTQLRIGLIERAEAFETKAEGERQRARNWRMLAERVQAPQVAQG